MIDILNRIFKLIDDSDISYKDFSLVLDLNSPSLISDWKSGKAKSYKNYIPQIANYFNVSTDYLYGRTDLTEEHKYDDLITAYTHAPEDVRSIINSLLNLSLDENGVPKAIDHIQKDTQTVLIQMFSRLNIISQSKIITMAAGELDKQKQTVD